MDQVVAHLASLQIMKDVPLCLSSLTTSSDGQVSLAPPQKAPVQSKPREPQVAPRIQAPCCVKDVDGKRYADARSMLDNGATGEAFIDDTYVRKHGLARWSLTNARGLKLANGQMGRAVREMTYIIVRHENHFCQVAAFITDLGRTDIDLILGIPWLRDHNPKLDYVQGKIESFPSQCQNNCLWQEYDAEEVRRKQQRKNPEMAAYGDIEIVSANAFMLYAKRMKNHVFTLTPQDFEHLRNAERKEDVQWAARQFIGEVQAASITAEDYSKFFDKLEKPPLSLEDIRKLVRSEYHKYLPVFDPKPLSTALPPDRGQLNHKIDLIDAPPPAARLRGTSRETAEVIHAYVKDMCGKGHIKPSTSPFAAPILVCAKPGGGLRICIDYRGLNAITVKNRNTPPLIQETLTRLSKARIFSKFDVITAFNELLVAPEDRHKTAFLCRLGLFEYVVMPFGLTGAPGTWQRFINEILRPYLDVFVTAYLDDILVYSESEMEHVEHVSKVLEALQANHVYLDISKCEFHVQRVKYLGLIVSTQGIEMDAKKVEAVRNWPTPHTVKDVQAFLGFANFYRRFIAAFSRIAAPLTNLTKGGASAMNKTKVAWGETEDAAFRMLKTAFTSAPILAHFDAEKPSVVEADASDYVVAAVLSQTGDDNLLHPVAFMSKKMSPQECNYDIYDKELLAIVRAFEEWRPELAGTADRVEILSDHQNLRYFMSTKVLNRRQARWAEFLSEFNFRITHRPGKENTKADSFTRLSADMPEDGNDARELFRTQTLLKPHQIAPEVVARDSNSTSSKRAVTLATMMLGEYELEPGSIIQLATALAEEELATEMEPEEATISNLFEHILEHYPTDEVLQRVMAAKKTGARYIPADLIKQGILIELAACEIVSHKGQEIMYVTGRLWVAEGARPETMRQHHDSLVGGHLGKEETYFKISRSYFWPGMTTSIRDYVLKCKLCRSIKPNTSGKQGLLKPLRVPDAFWKDLSMDFITPLPQCKYEGRTYEHLMVVVDRLSKMKRYIALERLDVQHITNRFIEWIWRTEGYPATLVSDRGTQFTSQFWKRLCQRIGTRPKLSSSFHPETDGQTERANAVVKAYLRAYVNFHQDNWVELLPVAEFVSNATKSTSTGKAPFEAMYGYIPSMGTEPPQPHAGSARDRAQQEAVDTMLSERERALEQCRAHMAWAQARQKDFADRHRRPAPEFKVGDKVMLDARNLKTNRPSRGLDHKNLGPYKIAEIGKWGSAIKLDLPDSCKIFPWFHPYLVHPCEVRDDGGPPPALKVYEGEEDFEVEAITNSKLLPRTIDLTSGTRGLLKYEVKWLGYDKKDWLEWYLCTGSPELVDKFHELHPGKPGPHRSFHDYTVATWDRWEADTDELRKRAGIWPDKET